MAKNGQLKLMEYLWLFFTVITAALFIALLIKLGFKEAYKMLILSVLSFLMYYWRKSLRKKEEQEGD